HAETQHNSSGLVQGRADNPLSELGRRQAAALGEALSSRRLSAVYSSPLRRALETARAVAEPHGLAVEVVHELVEMDIGEMEGLSRVELREQHAEFLKLWVSEHAGEAVMPGGESLRQVQDRAGGARGPIALAHPAGRGARVR